MKSRGRNWLDDVHDNLINGFNPTLKSQSNSQDFKITNNKRTDPHYEVSEMVKDVIGSNSQELREILNIGANGDVAKWDQQVDEQCAALLNLALSCLPEKHEHYDACEGHSERWTLEHNISAESWIAAIDTIEQNILRRFS